MVIPMLLDLQIEFIEAPTLPTHTCILHVSIVASPRTHLAAAEPMLGALMLVPLGSIAGGCSPHAHGLRNSQQQQHTAFLHCPPP